jgi:hypothetical protein
VLPFPEGLEQRLRGVLLPAGRGIERVDEDAGVDELTLRLSAHATRRATTCGVPAFPVSAPISTQTMPVFAPQNTLLAKCLLAGGVDLPSLRGGIGFFEEPPVAPRGPDRPLGADEQFVRSTVRARERRLILQRRPGVPQKIELDGIRTFRPSLCRRIAPGP